MDVINLYRVNSFVTKDGSLIRELLAHRNSCIQKQSLAEARVPVDFETDEHFHPKTEEIYYILSGKGLMTLNGEEREVIEGDAIAIPPGAHHKIKNIGERELRFLCCCSPAYEHDDTVMVDEET